MGLSLETEGISKHFGPVVANDNLSVSFGGGKIYAILGENGAGKTTFLNILAGIYRPDRGKIRVDGKECHFKSPKDALNKGIFLVQQNFSLIDNFTVAENLALLKGASLSRLNLNEVVEKLNEFSSQFGQKIDPNTVISKLPLYFRQLVEIEKGLIFGARVLMLDEPTSVLGPQEVEELATILKSLVSEGKTVVLTSHKLSQVMKIGNDFTVMRRGQVVFQGIAAEVKHTGELVRHMFGEEFTVTLPNKQGPARS
jgi:simple sugar transport system ATP-binding protein